MWRTPAAVAAPSALRPGGVVGQPHRGVERRRPLRDLLEVGDQVRGEVVERAAGGGHVDEPEQRRAQSARPRTASCIAFWSSERSGWRAGEGKRPASSRPIRCTSASRLAGGDSSPLIRARAILPYAVRAMRGQVLRHHQDRGRARGGAPRRLGDRAQPLGARARAAATPGPRSQISAELRRKVEVAGVFVNADPRRGRAAAEDESLVDGPAPRRRGPGLLPRGRPAHRLPR